MPGSQHVHHAGDVLDIRLVLSEPCAGLGWVRTNLGAATTRRDELIRLVVQGEPILHRDWHDLPMRRIDNCQFALRLPLADVGRFEVKAFFLAEGQDEPSWPPGENTVIKVEPADTVCANTIYTAFVRQFGPNLAQSASTPEAEAALRLLDAQGYIAIPRSGTFRDLIRHLDFIHGTLGFRILQLLPIHPVPTTFARMGRFGSPFAALDYRDVDPALAEFDRRTTPLQQFGELIDAVHGRGAKLFMDMPINHTGWASHLQIHHPEWFARNADATFTSPGAWGVTWEDLSKLDYAHRGLWHYMADVFLYWCRQGVDGFRCDAGYMIPVPVWEYITAEVRTQFPDTVFLLEGLGGPPAAVDQLLSVSNLDWAYSELFQKVWRSDVAACVSENVALAASRGLHVHYAETHDNARLAARSPAWADMRTALAALVAPAGGFGITNGVEWHATEKVIVHGAQSLAWGSSSNQVERLRCLSALLRTHPAFSAGARVTVIDTGDSAALAVSRTDGTGGHAVLVLVNLAEGQPATATWPTTAFPGAGEWHDVLNGEDVTTDIRDGLRACALAPAQVRCLVADPAWREQFAQADPGTFTGEPARALAQRRRAKILDLQLALHGFGDVSDLDVDHLSNVIASDPVAALQVLGGALPAHVVIWTWPVDASRVVMVPPGHALCIRAEIDFAVDWRQGDRVLRRERALPDRAGKFTVLLPARATPAVTTPGSLDFTVFAAERAQHVTAAVLHLASVANAVVHTRFSKTDALQVGAYAVAANTCGTCAQVRAAWGTLRSQYDALLAVNLHPEFPVDRRIMFTRCRVWLLFRGYSHPLDERCLEWFGQEADGAVVWRFAVPAGLGKRVPLDVTLRLAPDRNALRLVFRRLTGSSPDHLEPDAPVKLVLRPDIEDRQFHEKTKAFAGPEHAWPTAIHARPDGFTFEPTVERALHVQLEGSAFTHAAEWAYMVPHPEEGERGLDASSDLFSPGYFVVRLHGARTVALTAEVAAGGRPPEPFVNPHEPAAARRNKPVALGDAMAVAMRDFVVRRGSGRTVIAGYPWFLDWGRDTMICLRGLIAAGMLDASKAILKEFARFEDRGTLPNLIHGADASNRDTSDAPLWFFTACADVLAAEGNARFLATRVAGRSIKAVLVSMARAYMQGTPNGIRMDCESGLIFSPAHFTWMDTNFPAGTPREGYPVEIQALWHAALRLLAAHDQSGPWAALGEQVRASILKFYVRGNSAGSEGLRYLSDCLHAQPGQTAAEAEADDALRPNQLLAITLGAVEDAALGSDILRACDTLLVPGAIRSLANRPVQRPIAVARDGKLLNDPQRPYWGRYEGDEDTRRKPAYHNGTAWTWLFPSYSEALYRLHGKPMRATAAALLGSATEIINRDCIRHVPEILDGDAPHRGRGCGAQAWGCTELYRVLALLRA